MEEVYLYGAGGHAKVIAEILELQGIVVKGIFDDDEKITKLLDYPALGSFLRGRVADKAAVIISVGNNRIRQKIAEKLSVPFSRALHPSALISRRATIGEGSVLMAGVTVNSESTIGRHVILNTQCSVDHDCQINDYVHISPQVALAGNVKVGEGTHIGIGATVIQGISIGRWCTIGAGSVIIRDVPDGATVVGNPGRIIKTVTVV
jgi:sugar O-acyltransferase (sialic acid O-acetyltransferase NeuD family)